MALFRESFLISSTLERAHQPTARSTVVQNLENRHSQKSNVLGLIKRKLEKLCVSIKECIWKSLPQMWKGKHVPRLSTLFQFSENHQMSFHRDCQCQSARKIQEKGKRWQRKSKTVCYEITFQLSKKYKNGEQKNFTQTKRHKRRLNLKLKLLHLRSIVFN